MSDQQSRIMNEAGEWWLRRFEANGDVDAAFEHWLAADSAHADAYARLAATWEEMGASPQLAALADPDAAPRGRRFTSRPLVLGAMALAAGLSAFLLIPSVIDPPQARYATEIAELERVTLADGSVVTVGADSQIEVRMTAQERRVRLRGGEAFFEVSHDPARPFYVEAGDAQVRVIGTKFDVRRTTDSVAIAVREGLVRVRRAQGEVGLLRAGERVDIVRPTLLSSPPPPTIAPINAAPAGAWVSGRLNYNDARLADVVADINRYYEPGVRLDSDARELRVTAGFATSEISDFMELMSDVVPVDVERRADGAYRVAARD